MTPRLRTTAVRFGVAASLFVLRSVTVILSVILARAGSEFLQPRSGVAGTLLIVMCVILSSWFAGRSAGILATLTSIVITWNDRGKMSPVIWFGLSLTVGGTLSLLVGQVRDSRRRMIEALERLQASEDGYRRIIDTADEGIWIMNANGEATYVNHRAAEMLGLSPEDVIGRPLGDFTFTTSGPDALASAIVPLREGRSTRFDLRLKHSDGTPLWARVSASPFQEEDGSGEAGILAMLADVSDRVRIEEKLRRSESRFRRLAESGLIGIAVLDSKGRATEANDEFLRLVGGDRADLARGRVSLTGSTPPQYREQDRWKLQELRDLGAVKPFLKEYFLKEGGRSAVLVGATRLYEDSSTDGESVGFMLDISARRRAEDAIRFLAEAGEVLGCSLDYDVTLAGVARLAVPRLADLCTIDILEHDGRVNRVSSASNQPQLDDYPGLRNPSMRSPVAEVLRTGQPIVGLGSGPNGSGESPRHSEKSPFMIVPLSARGRTFGAISLWSDGPGRKFDAEDLSLAEELARRSALAVDNARLFADANQARLEAERADRSKNQFLAALSHELRTPLTPVLIEVGAQLNDPKLSPDLRPVFEVIRRNVELEARLIDDLLDVTRISQGKLRLNRSVVDSHQLVEQAAEICRGDADSAGLTIELDLAARCHHVEGDSARLQQILWNLVKNAVKFTPREGTIRIRSRNDASGSRLVLEVADTGIGIEPEVLPRIFDAFEQGSAQVTKQFGGLGLGLAISKSLAEAHGGRLTATSVGKGHGSTFRCELAALPRNFEARLSNPAAGAAKPDESAARSLRILLAEDNADTLRVLSRLLRVRGHTVATASGYRDALELADSSGPYDLLISDIGLPDGSGLDLMAHLRGENRPALSGIALSGYGTEDDVRKSREAGFETHLIKPIDFDSLERAIKRILVKSH